MSDPRGARRLLVPAIGAMGLGVATTVYATTASVTAAVVPVLAGWGVGLAICALSTRRPVGLDAARRAVARGAFGGLLIGFALNGALELVNWLQYGVDEEWIDSFLFWDVPSTVFCAGVGACFGAALAPHGGVVPDGPDG